MTISIHDQENNRVIVARVPKYLTDMDASSDDIAGAIITALGLSAGSCEYMIGEFAVHVQGGAITSSIGANGLAEFTQDFEHDALAALDEANS